MAMEDRPLDPPLGIQVGKLGNVIESASRVQTKVEHTPNRVCMCWSEGVLTVKGTSAG